jgi:hypothetical protein
MQRRRSGIRIHSKLWIALLVTLSIASASALLVNPCAFVDILKHAKSTPSPTTPDAKLQSSTSAPAPRLEEVPAALNEWRHDEYKVATAEILARIEHHQTLFTLKFTIVGAILALLFNLLNKNAVEDFESFVRKRRSAVFFSAALFASVVIDAQLRNNIDMIVTLGDWVRTALSAFLPGESSTWEDFFQRRMSSGVFPILRNMSHLLTALLYAVMLVMFFVMPRGSYRTTGNVFWVSIVFFIFLAAIGASYRIDATMVIPIALVGMLSVGLAYWIKTRAGNICKVVGDFGDYLEAITLRDASVIRALEKEGFSSTVLEDVRTLIRERRDLDGSRGRSLPPALLEMEI